MPEILIRITLPEGTTLAVEQVGAPTTTAAPPVEDSKPAKPAKGKGKGKAADVPPVDAPPADTKAAEPATIEQLRTEFLAASKKNKINALEALGAQKISLIPESEYAAVLERLKAINNAAL